MRLPAPVLPNGVKVGGDVMDGVAAKAQTFFEPWSHRGVMDHHSDRPGLGWA